MSAKVWQRPQLIRLSGLQGAKEGQNGEYIDLTANDTPAGFFSG